ncbi:Pectinesterase [Handroanthus impetiginosus]|uniref:Pectinesterase n=1 Tax=Handroanthus impetiginosus TaxID=429701 RepID=A0A2G9HDL4_9LAMI|nr:Pectinesterase [Handroanthus impetiginosus]
MPPIFHAQLLTILYFLSLSNPSFNICISATTDTNFNKWISWRLNNYHQKYLDRKSPKTIFSKKMSATLDLRLRMAEMNRKEIKVSQDGTGNFKTVTEAIDSVPLYNTRRVLLHISSGIYREKVSIPKTKHFITFIGNAKDPPTITGNDTAATVREGGDGTPLRTFQSATVAVDADYFMAINVKFENTAPHVVGTVGGQAVALRISGTKAAFYNCSFYGSQDTLYDHKGLHFFSNCFIQGSVDFIFGNGTSLYENCYLNSIAKKVASVTAQKRSNSSISSGFSFKNCTITGTGSIYLGRAWGDYSRVVFSYSFMDKIVLPQGWSDWGKKARDQKVYYGEYKCSGPGANLSGRVPWARLLTDEEALPFIGTYYIDGDSWLINPSAYQL